MDRTSEHAPPDDPLWYKDAVIYELHVRAFADANGDGIGDFKGLTSKLDYLADLGVTTLWLLPFYPSPLRDDGYDIADYTTVHPNYGTLDDFREFLDQAHRRGLRVITELVINHTSDQHPWFQRARRAPKGSPERDFYVWSDDPNKFSQARIIFQDFETSNWAWDPVAQQYYIHRFYSHQPDLNYDNPAVHDAILPLLDYWFDMGVDGMRLDAIPYLYKREGTTCENLPETHTFLKKLRAHADRKFRNRMFLAEANQWPEDASAYFGAGDECHMNFHFPLMPRLFMALRMEDRFPIVDILDQTPSIPANCQWGLFLRNHDELTLEMVTEEERDYMIRAYAAEPRARINLGIRRRLAPLLGNDRRRIELMHGLLFALPGTPVMYYGDEFGMGDNIYLGDRNGVRTPMHWSGDRNAGFSRANPQKLYLPVIIDPEYHYEANNVEAQQGNPHSLLWWVKRLLALRKRMRAFGRGTLTFLQPDNAHVLAFLRTWVPAEGEAGMPERVLVVANLSRFAQHVELSLSEFQGHTPVELFGQTPFPPISAEPYRLTLGPHTFYWFALAAPRTAEDRPADPSERLLPVLPSSADWSEVLRGPARRALQELLPDHLARRRWFRGGNRPVRSTRLSESVFLPNSDPPAHLAAVRVEYLSGDGETYLLPLAFAPADRVEDLLRRWPRAGVARLRGGSDGLLYDPAEEPGFASALLRFLAERGRQPAASGELFATLTTGLNPLPVTTDAGTERVTARSEAGHLIVTIGDRLVLRLYRLLLEGIHPDLEVGRFLSHGSGSPVLPVLGSIEYRLGSPGEPVTVALLQAAGATQGDAWHYTLGALGLFAENAVVAGGEPPPVAGTAAELLAIAAAEPTPEARRRVGEYLEDARRLGRTTAALHRGLTRPTDDPLFVPERFTPHYQRGIFQSMRNSTVRAWQRLARRLHQLPEAARPLATELLDLRPTVLARFQHILDTPLTGLRIRPHGDFHLGQLMRSGQDFVVARFESGPVRTPNDRRLRRSPLRDLVELLVSWRHAADSVLYDAADLPLTIEGPGRGEPGGGERGPRMGSTGVTRPEDRERLRPWLEFWLASVGGAFLGAYFADLGDAHFLPRTEAERAMVIDCLLLERTIVDLVEDLAAAPERVPGRLRTLRGLIG